MRPISGERRKQHENRYDPDTFRTGLTEDEFRKSGADKTEGLRLNLKLTRFHLGWLVKKAMAGRPTAVTISI